MKFIRPNAQALIKHDGKILVQKGIDNATGVIFYRMLGGGVEFGEKSVDTIRRELIEELGLTILNEKLITIIENVFDFNTNQHHEICFIYEAEIEDKNLYTKDKIPRVDKEGSYAEWVSTEEFKNSNLKLYPEGVVEYI